MAGRGGPGEKRHPPHRPGALRAPPPVARRAGIGVGEGADRDRASPGVRVRLVRRQHRWARGLGWDHELHCGAPRGSCEDRTVPERPPKAPGPVSPWPAWRRATSPKSFGSQLEPLPGASRDLSRPIVGEVGLLSALVSAPSTLAALRRRRITGRREGPAGHSPPAGRGLGSVTFEVLRQTCPSRRWRALHWPLGVALRAP